MRRLVVLLSVLALTVVANAKPKMYTLTSPDGRLVTHIVADGEGMTYDLGYDGKQLMLPSELGLYGSSAKAEGAENTSFDKGDAVRLNFADETFDAVCSNYVYHNIPSRNRQEILMETLRVLKKGGTFAIHDIFSPLKYGDMQMFVQRLKNMGYVDVRLVPTNDGLFMSRREAFWLGLKGSAILVGKK